MLGTQARHWDLSACRGKMWDKAFMGNHHIHILPRRRHNSAHPAMKTPSCHVCRSSTLLRGSLSVCQTVLRHLLVFQVVGRDGLARTHCVKACLHEIEAHRPYVYRPCSVKDFTAKTGTYPRTWSLQISVQRTQA